MEVQFDRDNDSYYVKEKIDGQTYQMNFERYDDTLDTDYYNVSLSIYSKRKDISKNEDNHLMTGKNPMATIAFARKAFNALEQQIIRNKVRAVVSVWGTDPLRKKAYERFLIPKGYKYGFIAGLKSLVKVYN